MKNIEVKSQDNVSAVIKLFEEKYDLSELLYSDIVEILSDIVAVETAILNDEESLADGTNNTMSFAERAILRQQLEILSSSIDMFRLLYYPTFQ